MTETMVERVARAICKAQGGVGDAEDFRHFEWVDQARAAIAAMREPSLEVLAAGFEAIFEGKWDGTQAPMMGAGFDAMIDAALSESKENQNDHLGI